MRGFAGLKFCPWIVPIISLVCATQMVQGHEASDEAPRFYPRPSPTYRKFWFFNVTNADEFLLGNPLELAEVGPYVFREVIEREVTGTFENGTVEYYDTRTFFFAGEESVGDQSESITFFNAPVFGLAGKMAEDPLFSLLLSTISKLLEHFEEGQPFVTKTVKELLFEGYYMPFFENLTAVLDAFGMNSEEIWDAQLPPDMRDFRFAFYRMNETVDGPYLVGTGEEDPSDFGRIHLWHGRPYVFNEPWGSHECNAINGTDGTVFPPSIDKEDIIYTFVLHLFRSIHFKYEKDVEVGGHLGYRFVIHPDAVASTDVRPENECFCVNGECLGAGLLDVSASVYGKPVIMSSPHFYVPEGAGETGFNASLIHGISPNKDSHETFIVVEPSAGFILEARRRLQTSIKVRSIDGYRTFENFPAMELPAFWMEESADLVQGKEKMFQQTSPRRLQKSFS